MSIAVEGIWEEMVQSISPILFDGKRYRAIGVSILFVSGKHPHPQAFEKA
jgi:hypothetical protein